MPEVRRRSLYDRAEDGLRRTGLVSDGHLHAWEYDPTPERQWSQSDGEFVRLWRTRRPDLAPPELWIGETPGSSEG